MSVTGPSFPPSERQSADHRRLAERLGDLLMSVMTRGQSGFMDAVDEAGLTLSQLKMLARLHEQPAGAAIGSVGCELGLTPASSSRVADSLVRRGLAERTEDPDDRRVKRLSPTAEGHELARGLIEQRLAGLQTIVADLDPESRRRLELALDALDPEEPR